MFKRRRLNAKTGKGAVLSSFPAGVTGNPFVYTEKCHMFVECIHVCVVNIRNQVTTFIVETW